MIMIFVLKQMINHILIKVEHVIIMNIMMEMNVNKCLN